MDPDNASLASDTEELRAALAPADATALRQRGAARFSAGVKMHTLCLCAFDTEQRHRKNRDKKVP